MKSILFVFLLFLLFCFFFTTKMIEAFWGVVEQWLEEQDLIRNFDFDYILFDFAFLLIWIFTLLSRGEKYPLLHALAFSIFIYNIDAIVWFNTPNVPPSETSSAPPNTPFIREYFFKCGEGLKESWGASGWEGKEGWIGRENVATPYNYFLFENLYVVLKHGCDFMMLISYSFVFFAWSCLCLDAWVQYVRDSPPKKIASNSGKTPAKTLDPSSRAYLKLLSRILFPTFLFVVGIFSIPLLTYLSRSLFPSLFPIIDCEVFTVRHMNYLPNLSNPAIAYNSFCSYLLLNFLYFSPKTFCFVFFVGTLQALVMELPLFLFEIRPIEWHVLFFEALFLLNQYSATLFITMDNILPLLPLGQNTKDMNSSNFFSLFIGSVLVILINSGIDRLFDFWWGWALLVVIVGGKWAMLWVMLGLQSERQKK